MRACGLCLLALWLPLLWAFSWLAATDVFQSDLLGRSLPVPRPVPQHVPLTPQRLEETPFFFVQVSDLHINHLPLDNSLSKLRLFLTRVLESIAPPVVLATGDLTNAKLPNRSSRQQHAEWADYAHTVTASPAFNQTLWLDIRGNHDSFGVHDWHASQNLFRSYGVDSHSYSTSNPYVSVHAHGDFRFIGFDAAGAPAAHRPTNFFGFVPLQLQRDLHTALATHAIPNRTILYSHYPASTLEFQSSGSSLDYIVADVQRQQKQSNLVTAHLSGHLHTLLDTFPQGIRASQRGSFLELEAADLWTSWAFRIAAFDADTFVYADHRLDPDKSEQYWLLLTNPPALSTTRGRQAGLARMSTHIRFFLFASNNPHQPTPITVLIDNQPLNHTATDHGNFFHTVPWNPTAYDDAHHDLTFQRDGRTVGTATFSFAGEEAWRYFRPVPLARRVAETVFGLTRFPVMIHILVVSSLATLSFLLLMLPRIPLPSSREQSHHPTTALHYQSSLALLLHRLATSPTARPLWIALLSLTAYAGLGPTIFSTRLTDPSRAGMACLWGVVYFPTPTDPLEYIPRKADQGLILVFLIFKCLFPLLASSLLYVATALAPHQRPWNNRTSILHLVSFALAWQQCKESGRTAYESHGLVGFMFSVGGLPASAAVSIVFLRVASSMWRSVKPASKST